MALPDLLHNVGAGLTLALSAAALFRPAWIARLASLAPRGAAGDSELRAVFGGFFGGAATFAMFSQDSIAFAAVGAAWLGAAATRIPAALRPDGGRALGAIAIDAAVAVLLLFPR